MNVVHGEKGGGGIYILFLIFYSVGQDQTIHKESNNKTQNISFM